MKKLLLIAMALVIGTMAYSQKAYKVSKDQAGTKLTTTVKMDVAEELPFNNTFDPTVRSSSVTPEESIIGTTFYDLQTNTMLQGRIYKHADGTVGAVWTRGVEATTFPDRGTGYNYFDGAAWGPAPTARVESVRTGWPSYAPLGPNGEIIVAHNGSTGLQVSTRENKGTGAWTESLYQGPAGIENNPTWPRIAVGGENNDVIHLIYDSYVAYNDQTTALLYSRSTDGGATWDPKDQTFDEFGPSYYLAIGGDNYAIEARGNYVAILISDTWDCDLAMVKSSDGGDTWEHTIIREHPYPFFDFNTTITDTFTSVDGSASMAIGPDGKVHVTFGICQVIHDSLGTTFSYWPAADGIGYWNEDMPVFGNDRYAIAEPSMAELLGWTTMLEYDYNIVGWMQDINNDSVLDLQGGYNGQHLYRTIGLSTMPAITVDNENNVFIAFASLTETFDNGTSNYRRIWARGFANGSWGDFMDVTGDVIHIFDECIYPVFSPTSDESLYLMYQADQLIGLGLDEDHEYVNNNVNFALIPKTDLLTGVKENNDVITSQEVSQNYPNPFSEMTTIAVNLKAKANLSLTVYNIVGQEVMKIERGNVNAGAHYFEVDGSRLGDGVYFYTVTADKSTVTKKMIVR
jgi:hypothetical protein